MFRSCPPWRRCRDIPTLPPAPFFLLLLLLQWEPNRGRRVSLKGWLQKTVLTKALMATLCCPINKTYPWTKGSCFRVLSPFLQISHWDQKEWRRERSEEGMGESLSCCFGCLENSTPATCILASLARLKAYGRGGFIGDSSCSCWGVCSQPFEEDESDGLGCAVLDQPCSLDGTCLQFSLAVTHPTDL